VKEVESEVRAIVRGFREAQLLATKSRGRGAAETDNEDDERERVRMEVPRSD
jgi:hypothetical protein